MLTAAPPLAPTALVIGKENVGKSSLVSTLTGRSAEIANFGGSTVAVERYRSSDGWELLDTPGILRDSDTATTRAALEQLDEQATVLLTVQATHLDDDLADLIPLLTDKRGVIAVTHWDRVHAVPEALAAIERLQQELGVPLFTVDARQPDRETRRAILDALLDPPAFSGPPRIRAGWRIEPPPGLLERPLLGPPLAAVLLLLPAVVAVGFANMTAAWLDPLVGGLIKPLVTTLAAWPEPWAAVLAGSYGLFTMGPMLLVWAVPTVVLYAFLLGAYKASGLAGRINVAMHPLACQVGLSGRDVVRVMMGFGCNVPAVISTRACSSCSRGTAISAISFGAACSYQFPATLAVFAACGQPWLVVPFLLYLGLTTLIYLRLTAPREAISPLNRIMTEGRVFVGWPRWKALWAEVRGTLGQFFFQALPVFFLITFIASLLALLGVVDAAAGFLKPLMGIFHLPTEASLPVLMASIRKDGILLFIAQGQGAAGLAAPMNPAQVLTAVYLAGVLLPCLVTALTIAREVSWRFALQLIARQAAAAALFAALLGWGGWLVYG